MAETTANIDAIKGYLKKMDRQLLGRMLNGLSFFQDSTLGLMRGLKTETPLVKYTGAKGARRLNTTIDQPKDKGAYGVRNIVPRFGMKILSFIPDELKETYFSEFMDTNKKRIPFAEWVMSEEMKTLAEEINNNIYDAVYATADAFNAGTVYNVGDHMIYTDNIIYKCIIQTIAGDTPVAEPTKWVDADAACLLDGPGTVTAAEITGANLTAYAGGAFDNTDGYDVIKGQWEDDVPEAHKNVAGGRVAYVSYGGAEDIAQHSNTKFGSGQGIANADIQEGVPFYLKNTNKRLLVVPSLWMGTSRRIHITKRKNYVFGTDQLSNLNSIGKVVEKLHGYDTITKFTLAFQMRDLEEVSVNNQV
jgi:hypothetical protein